jgi:hypothetical protein
MSLKKRNIFRVGQVNRSKRHPLRSGNGPLALTEVWHIPLDGAPGGKKAMKRHILNDGSSPLSVFLLYFAEIITLLAMKNKRYYRGHLDN